MKDPILFTVGTGGNYITMKPNFEKGKLEETKLLIRAAEMSPFGFTEYLKGRGLSYSHPENDDLSESEVRLKTFKDFIKKIYALAKEKQVEYVLVDILEDSDRSTYWNIEGRCKLLINNTPK